MSALDKLKAGCAVRPGDSLPAVPDAWTSQPPTDAQLATPAGTLWSLVRMESDPAESRRRSSR